MERFTLGTVVTINGMLRLKIRFGGGGIAMLAGISGLFTFPLFLACVALAVLPVPLIILFSGG